MKSFFFAVALFVLSTAAQAADGKQMWAKSFINQKAPEIVVEQWLSQKPDTKGKFVLIDFWATWCGPCRRAIPELNAFHAKYKDKLVVIGISDETADKVNAMSDPKISYFSAIDTQARMKKVLGVKGIPHVIVIDPDGIVRWEGFPLLDGYELNDKALEEVFAAYVAKAKK